MKILITGASGLIGSALVPYLKSQGHTVKPIIRSSKPQDDLGIIRWDPDAGFIDYKDMGEADVFINLAGENIGDDRWTDKKKQEILSSRVNSTNFLSQCLSSLDVKPKLLINASAVGYYGNQNDSTLTEESPPGDGFLAHVCKEWEEATDYARRAGIRVVLARFGMVLSDKGGPLGQMIPPFSYGLGGRVGKGDQYWSWIAIDDLTRAINHIIENPRLEGPVNVTSPYPVTNAEFTKTLARSLNRPAFLPFPAAAVRFIFGDMGEELLLASQKVEPAKLIKTDFRFSYPELKEALKHYLS